MKFSANHIYFVITRIGLLAVYGVFITVQSINAYVSLKNVSPSFDNFIATVSSPTKNVVISSKSKDSQKSNIRLNKRFHPESIISLGYVSIEPAKFLIAKRIVSKPKDYLLISSILTDSLRGPPVVV